MNINAGREALHKIHTDKEGPNLGLWYLIAKDKFIHFPDGVTYNDATVNEYLRVRQFSFKKGEESISEGQAKKLEIRHQYRIDGAIEHSGWLSAGTHDLENSRRILVLKGANIVNPNPGEWPTIEGLLREAFGDEREYHLFKSWLSVAIKGFYDKALRKPGQLLILVGDSGCDFIQAIISAILGGKRVNPFDFYLEKGARPAELFEACAWTIDSSSIFSGNSTEKKRFTELLRLCSSPALEYKSRIYGTFQLPLFVRGNVALEWRARCVRSMAEYIFEPHEELIVLRCGLSGLPLEESFATKLSQELAAFIWHLLSEYEISAELFAPRFGVAGYFSSEIKNLCFVGTPEYEICMGLRKIAPDKKEYEEADLPGELEFAGMNRTQLSGILREKPLSVIMESLSEKFPDSFSLKTSKNRRIWKLNFKKFDVEAPF